MKHALVALALMLSTAARAAAPVITAPMGNGPPAAALSAALPTPTMVAHAASGNAGLDQAVADCDQHVSGISPGYFSNPVASPPTYPWRGTLASCSAVMTVWTDVVVDKVAITPAQQAIVTAFLAAN